MNFLDLLRPFLFGELFGEFKSYDMKATLKLTLDRFNKRIILTESLLEWFIKGYKPTF